MLDGEPDFQGWSQLLSRSSDASLRVDTGDISAMDRSFRARTGASRPCTCCLSGDDASRWF